MPDINSFRDPDTEKNVDIFQYQDPDQGKTEIPGFAGINVGKFGTSTPAAAGKTREAFVAGVGSGLSDVGRGVTQLGATVGEALGAAPEGAGAEVTAQFDKDRSAESQGLKQAFPENQSAVGVGQFVGQVAPMMAVPGPAATTFLGRMGVGAAMGAGVGAAQYTPEGQSKLKNIATGAAIGGAGTGLLEGALRGAKALLGGKSAIAETASGILQKAKAAPATEAGSRLNVPLSPAQAIDDAAAQKSIQGLRPTAKGQAKVSKFVEEQTTAVNQQVKNLMDDFTPEGVAQAKVKRTELYGALDNIQAPESISKIVQDNPKLQDLYAKAQQDSGFQQTIQGLDPKSIGYWDKFKQYVDDSKVASPSKFGFNEARSTLVNALDEVSPEYVQARALHSRISARQEIQDQLNEIRSGGQEASVKQIYDKFFSSPEKISSLKDEVMKIGGEAGEKAASQIDDMVTITQAISKNNSLEKLLNVAPAKSAVQSATSSENLGLGTILSVGLANPAPLVAQKSYGVLRDFTKGRYNDGVVEAMVNPAYAQKLSAIAKQASPQAAVSLATLASTIVTKPTEKDAKALPTNLLNSLGISKQQAIDYTYKDPDASVSEKAGIKPQQIQEITTALPKPQASKVVQLAQMGEEEYYNTYLNTPAKRTAYLEAMRKAGGDVAGTAAHLRELDRVSKEMGQVAETPKTTDSNKGLRLMFGILLGALFGGQLGALAMLALGGAKEMGLFPEKENKQEKAKLAMAKKRKVTLSKSRNKLLDSILSSHVRAISKRK